MAVPYTFGTATSSIPLSQLDSNFNTVITLGNTAIQLGNTVTTLNNMTLANVTISSGNVTITNVSITTANVTTANITTAVIGTETVTTSTITTANVTTANITTDNITNGTVITSLTLSYGTANGVAYLNGSKVLTTGSAITFDGTNFATTGTATAAKLIPTGSSATGNGMYLPATNSVGISTAGTNAVYIDASQNLGLGVTPSAWSAGQKAIQIGSSGAISDNGSTYFNFNNNCYFNTSNWYYKNTGSASQFQSNGNVFYWQQAPSGTAGAAISFTQAMTLDSSGNLLVGTTSAVGRLTVTSAASQEYGTFDAPTSGYAFFRLRFNGTSYGNIGQGNAVVNGGSNTDFGLNATTNMLFATNGTTERMRIDTSGNLLVGTTSTSVTSGGLYVRATSSGGTSLIIGHQSGVATGNSFAEFQYAGGLIGSITQSGTTAVLFNVTSDQRLKENIQDAESASALIDALQVRQFDWKTDNTHQRYGFIAQELVTVAPEAVHQPVNEDDMMAVDYSKLVPMLVKEIQSLRKRLTALEST
jgi:hypothetical protein